MGAANCCKKPDQIVVAVGRTDVVIKNAKNIFVLELKVDGSAQEALDQINSNNYSIPYKYTALRRLLSLLRQATICRLSYSL